jgi:hypothetical protein
MSQKEKSKDSKDLFRRIIIGLLIAFIVTQVLWAGRLFARIWNLSELRHQVVVQSSSGDNLDLAQFSVVNRGFGPAENVFIHINTRGSHIRWHQIDAQELYEIKTLDPEQGVINIWLDRLASDAWVEITIRGENLSQEGIRLSAASDEGTSVAIEQPTFTDQAQEYVGLITDLYSEAWYIVINSEAVQEASEWISTEPSLALYLEVVKGHEFQKVGLAVLILVLVVGSFFRYGHFLLAVFIGTCFLILLFFDLEEIPAKLFIVPTAGMTVIFIVWWFREEIDSDWLILPLLLLLGLVILILRFWDAWVPLVWVLSVIVPGVVTLIVRWLRIFSRT